MTSRSSGTDALGDTSSPRHSWNVSVRGAAILITLAPMPAYHTRSCASTVPRRGRDPRVGVAAHAGLGHSFLLLCPGDALEPFGVGHVRFDGEGRAQGQIEGRRS